MKIRYYTFGVSHPLAKYVQKITTSDDEDPRTKMIEAYGTDWCWEYLPEYDNITENGDGTVTIHGPRRDYTYTLLENNL